MSTRRQHRAVSRRQGQDWASLLAPPGQAWRLPLDALIFITLVFATFSYGAAEAWSQQIVAGLSLLILLYTTVACFAKPAGCQAAGSWTYVPIFAFFGLIILQAVPLPTGLVQIISPQTYLTRVHLLEDIGGPSGSMPLSLYPAATWRQLWPLLSVVAVFVATLNAYRSEAGVRRLAQILALAAATAIVLACYQNIGGAGPRFEGGIEHPRSGPFLNHSHFGQYVNLGIGAAIGLVLLQLNLASKKYGSFPRMWSKLTKDRTYVPLWIAVTIVVTGALAIMLSMTRGGVISFLAAGCLVSLLLIWRSPRTTLHKVGLDTTSDSPVTGKDKAAILLALGLLIVTVSLGFGFDQIYDRLATLKDFEQAEASRSHILRDLAPAIGDYPLFGTGFGTFEFVFPQYDSDVRRSLTTHAENEYAHMTLETGLAGLVCIFGFLGMVSLAAWRVVRNPVRSLDYIGFGLIFGLAAILIHSLSDFGQHLPAVALMTALTCAAILNLAALRRVRLANDDGTQLQPSSKTRTLELAAFDLGPRWLRVLGPTLLIALMVGNGIAAASLERPRQAALQFAAGQDIEARIYGNNPDLIRPGDDERMIRRYDAAAKLDTSNPYYAYLRDYFTWGLIGFDEDGQRAHDLSSSKDATQTLLKQLDASRRAAPTFGPPYRLAGEARFFGLEQKKQGLKLVALGQSLTPHDAETAFVAGHLAALDGDLVSAAHHFQTAVTLFGEIRRSVVDVLIHDFDDPGLAYTFAEKNPSALRHFIDLLKNNAEYQGLIAQAQREIRQITAAKAYADSPRPTDLAAMARILNAEGDTDQAIALYTQAIAHAPRQVQWRLDLGQIYADLGRPDEAVREARAVLQISPSSLAARNLLEDQVVHLGAPPQTDPSL